jgi:hypothetical protein
MGFFIVKIIMFKPPPKTEYTVLSLGSGVQSSAITLMAAEGEITPVPDFAVFADTQGEPDKVIAWLKVLRGLVANSKHPFPIYDITKGDLAAEQLKVRVSQGKGKKPKGETYIKKIIPFFGIQEVPILEAIYAEDFKLDDEPIGWRDTGKTRNEKTAAIGRACTEDYKILPIRKLIREKCKIKRGEKDVKVTEWIGISWDEMERVRESKVKWMQKRHPLLELKMNRRECIEWMSNHGYPTPPRSACVYCPFHSDAEWRLMRDEDPGSFSEAVLFDYELRKQVKKYDKFTRMDVYLHNSCQPLDKIDFEAEDKKAGPKWDFRAECEGMCGV